MCSTQERNLWAGSWLRTYVHDKEPVHIHGGQSLTAMTAGLLGLEKAALEINAEYRMCLCTGRT